jgi:hypothetical protein
MPRVSIVGPVRPPTVSGHASADRPWGKKQAVSISCPQRYLTAKDIAEGMKRTQDTARVCVEWTLC